MQSSEQRPDESTADLNDDALAAALAVAEARIRELESTVDELNLRLSAHKSNRVGCRTDFSWLAMA